MTEETQGRTIPQSFAGRAALVRAYLARDDKPVPIRSLLEALAWGDSQATYARRLEAQIAHLQIAYALADACDKAGDLLLAAAQDEIARLRGLVE